MPQHNAPQSVSKHIRDPTRSVVVHHQTFGLSPAENPLGPRSASRDRAAWLAVRHCGVQTAAVA